MNIKILTSRLTNILVVCAAGIANLSHADVAPRSAIAAERAATAITIRLLGHNLNSGQYAEGMYRGRRVAGFDGVAGDISIDRETGIVVDYVAGEVSASQETGPPTISSAGAFQIGLTFLRRSGIEPDGVWTLTDNDYHEVGTGFRQYNLIWHRIFRGVQLPSSIGMSLDADSGQVTSYHLVDDPVTITLQMNLTGEQALIIVSERKRWAHPIVKRANLSVWYPSGYPGPQALMWRFEIANPDAKTGSDSYAWADVNATTGDIVRLGEPAGFFGPMPKAQKAVSVLLPKLDLKALRRAKVPPTVFQLAKLKKPK